MCKITKLSLEDFINLHNKITTQVVKHLTLEEAAQEYMSILYEALNESIILARFLI